MPFFIGIDASTTATKALLMDQHGQVLGVSSTGYTYETPKPLWSEQSPDLWWEGACQSIQKLLQASQVPAENIAGIGLTGQMHGLVLLDAQGKILRPAILWNDQRTAAQCDHMRAVLGKEKLIQLTGNDALTGFTAPKILWVRDEEPDLFSKVAHVLLPKDYVRYKLTGEFAVDKAGGAGTILFDIKTRTWSQEILHAFDLPPDWFPPTYEGPEVTGRISREAALATGLMEGTPVVGGGGDQAAQAVGVGAVEAGIIAVTLGTSGVVFATTAAPLIEPEGRLHAFCHAVPGHWHFMGVMLSAAGSLQWYRDTFFPGEDFDSLVSQVEGVPAGSEGLLFLPYLTGERSPHPDPLARGAWVGLTVRHRKPHLTRSVLEGVAFGLKDNFSLIQKAGLGEIKQVRISGGGAKSKLWRQMIADVLGVELVTVNTTEGAAYGAALLASVGAGIFSTVKDACHEAVKVTDQVLPGNATEYYQKIYPSYQALYPALKDGFHSLVE